MNIVRWFRITCLILPAAYFAGCGNMFGDFLNDPDNTGEVQWATPMKNEPYGGSYFKSVAVDVSGNIYAVGYTDGGTFDFGGSSVSFTRTNGPSVIVKYNSFGVAQWATPIVTGSDHCAFSSVAVDTQGNVYAAGHVTGSGEFDFGGNSFSFSGKLAEKPNAVIVKYNSSGIAQWATPVNFAYGQSQFNSIALDAQGNIYAVGIVFDTKLVNFGGSGVEVSGKVDGENNYSPVIVKYNSSGVAQWAQTVIKASSSSQFTGVATDKSGNAYAVGDVTGSGSFDFVGGSGTDFPVVSAFKNAVIVKYNSSGAAQWATPVKASPTASEFNGVAVDRSGNILTVGYLYGEGPFDFGGDSDAFTGKSAGFNAVIVKYNASGIAQWVSSVETAPADSKFNGVSVDVLGNAYAVGYVIQTGSFYFGGNSSPITGKTERENTVIVKYNESGIAQWAKTLKAVESNDTEAACEFTDVAVDGSGYSYAVGYMKGVGEFDFGGKSNPRSNNNMNPHTIIVKYY